MKCISTKKYYLFLTKINNKITIIRIIIRIIIITTTTISSILKILDT